MSLALIDIPIAGADVPFKAGAAITKGAAVKLDTNGDVIVTSAITDVVIGVALTDQATVGGSVAIRTLGIARVITGGSVAIGAQLMPKSAGAGKALTAAGATAVSFGIALTAGTNDGEFSTVLLGRSVNTPANA